MRNPCCWTKGICFVVFGILARSRTWVRSLRPGEALVPYVSLALILSAYLVALAHPVGP